MARWIMIAMLVLGAVLVFVTKSSVLAGLGVVMVLGGLIGATFSLAASRITSRARNDSAMLSPEVMQAIRDKATRDAASRGRPALPPTPLRRD